MRTDPSGVKCLQYYHHHNTFTRSLAEAFLLSESGFKDFWIKQDCFLNPFWILLFDLLGRNIVGDDAAVNFILADAPGNELGVLRSEIEDEDEFFDPRLGDLG